MRLLWLTAWMLVPAWGQVKPPASAIFDTDNVQEIRLTFAQPDWFEQLTKNFESGGADLPYSEASIVWGDAKFASVGVRFKGTSSYANATTQKKPFRIKLNEFVKGQKVDGMASFSLSNAWNDPSFVREKAYYELAAAAGLPASRSGFAALYINDKYWGLYVLTESVSSDYLKAHFGKDDGGNLYKAEVPNSSLVYLGADPAAYLKYFSKQSNETANDWTDFIELCRVLDQGTAAQIEALVDVDQVMTALALDNLTANLDSYAGMGQNYYLYHRPSDGKWSWIVWDPSLAFGALSMGLMPGQLGNLPVEWGGSLLRPLAYRLWQTPAFEARYRAIFAKLLAQYAGSGMLGRMDALRSMIRPYVAADKQKLCTMAEFEAALDGSPVETVPAVGPLMATRTASVATQLGGKAAVSVEAIPASVLLGAGGFQNVALAFTDPTASGTFTASAGAPWIVLGSTSGGLPAVLKISANAGSMSVGSYSGSVTVTAGGAVVTVPVTLVVASAPGIITSSSTVTFSKPEMTAAGLTVASTSGTAGFAITVNGGTCGDRISVNPASGVTPMTVAVMQNGAPANCTATLTIRGSEGAPATVGVSVGAVAPVISAVTNAASFATGAVSPGEIVTLFGSNLGPSVLTTGTYLNGRLTGRTAGVEAMFGSTAAPVLYASAGQTSVLVPFDVSGATTVTLTLNGRTSSAVPVDMKAASPGIFAITGDGTRGSYLSIYFTGGGALAGSGIAGVVATTAQTITSQAEVTIGGMPATVSYAGVVPGAIIGLYQINALVPAGATPGSAPVVVRIAGVDSKAFETTLR